MDAMSLLLGKVGKGIDNPRSLLPWARSSFRAEGGSGAAVISTKEAPLIVTLTPSRCLVLTRVGDFADRMHSKQRAVLAADLLHLSECSQKGNQRLLVVS